MTDLLEQVILKVKRLPENQQNMIAAIILEELEDEFKWEESFAHSHNVLAMHAAEAMEEHSAGMIEVLNPVTLHSRELTQLEAELAAQPEHSWVKFAGMFENDSQFEQVLESIEEFRRSDREEYFCELDAETASLEPEHLLGQETHA